MSSQERAVIQAAYELIRNGTHDRDVLQNRLEVTREELTRILVGLEENGKITWDEYHKTRYD